MFYLFIISGLFYKKNIWYIIKTKRANTNNILIIRVPSSLIFLKEIKNVKNFNFNDYRLSTCLISYKHI